MTKVVKEMLTLFRNAAANVERGMVLAKDFNRILDEEDDDNYTTTEVRARSGAYQLICHPV